MNDHANDIESIKKLIAEKQYRESAQCDNRSETAGQQWAGSPVKGLGGYDGNPCCRVTVHDVIDQKLSDLRLQLNQLDALRRQLPQEMNLPAQEALINLIRKGY